MADLSIFRDKLVVITGASSGIGYEMSRLLARSGSRLVLVSRNAGELERVKRDLSTNGGFVEIIPADLSRKDECEALIGKLEALGSPVDVLINNAGFGVSGEYVDTPWDEIEKVIAVSSVAVAHLTHWAASRMKQRRSGYLLNVSAAAGFQPQPYFAAFGACKAFVTSLSVALYQELKAYNVVVSCLHPGATESAFGKRAGIDTTRALRMFGTMPAEFVARVGLEGLAAKRPFVIAGALYKMIYYSSRITPKRMGLKLMSFLFQK